MNPRDTIPPGNDGISRGLGSAAGATRDDRPVLVLDGDTLTCDALVKAARGEMRIAVADTVWARICAGRDVVDQIVESGASAYGITTGVGDDLAQRLFNRKTQNPDADILIVVIAFNFHRVSCTNKGNTTTGYNTFFNSSSCCV